MYKDTCDNAQYLQWQHAEQSLRLRLIVQFDDWSIFEIIKDNVKRNLQCN